SESAHRLPLRAQYTCGREGERGEEEECEEALWEHDSSLSSQPHLGKYGDAPIAGLLHALAEKENFKIFHGIRFGVQADHDFVLQHLGFLPEIWLAFVDV